MKRFLILISIFGVLVLAVYYSVTHHGFYIDVSNNDIITIDFQTKGKELINSSTGNVFVVKGVDVTADMPHRHASDFAPDKADYLRWMEQIGDMGANTIRTMYIMDTDFYNALFDYNTSHAEPLYLICSISVSDKANYSYGDAYSDDFLEELKENSFKTVDIVHGNRTVKLTDSSEKYTKDVSDWVLGYIIGSGWNADMIAYTNNQKAYNGVYKGEYFETAEGAQPFEAVMAEVMDELTAYETDKYNKQCPVGFINDPQNDFLEYEDYFAEPLDKFHDVDINAKIYARDLNKVNRIDAEKVKPTDKMKAGTFAAYRLFDFCPDFYNYLSAKEKERVSAYVDFTKEYNDSYDGYLTLLGAYHTMPVIGGFGYSTSRGTTDNSAGLPYTEEQQGNKLATVYQDMIASKWSGGIINGWQDRWEGRSWNTTFAKNLANSMEWKDVQTDASGNGIMEFDSNAVAIDGNDEDWTEEDYLCSYKGLSLYVKMDGEGLCFMAKGEKADENTRLYIPVDITPKTGSKTIKDFTVTFSMEADFLIVIDGRENSRILVHKRYDATRENFEEEISGENPFEKAPDINTDEFVPVRMTMVAHDIERTFTLINDEVGSKPIQLPAYETGKLRHGINDVNSEDYDSLADFCFGEKKVEVRIPYLLMNFHNPAQLTVHDDYYEHYGVEPMDIKSINLGIGFDNGEIPMVIYWPDWDNNEYNERLKKSYYVVRSAWREQNAE